MEIFHIVENLDDRYGGPAKSIPYLASELNNLGYNNELVSLKLYHKEYNEVICKFGLKWSVFNHDFFCKLRFSFGIRSYLKTVAKREHVVIFHTHNLWNYIPYVAAKLSKRDNVKCIMAIRGSLYPWSLSQSKFRKLISWHLFQKRALNNCDVVHVTEVEELKAVRNLGITAPIALVPNGVYLEEFENMRSEEKAKLELGLADDRKYCLFLSRIHPKKGLDFLLRAFVKLATQFPDWDLLIVGPIYDSVYYAELIKILKDNCLESRVVFKGMLQGQSRIDCFSACDLFVLPSHTENFGIAIAEAMAARLPVITTKGTPWHEIEKYDAGWWVDLDDSSIFKALSCAFSYDSAELRKKGLNAHKLATKYNWHTQGHKMHQVYQWLLNKQSTPSFIDMYD